MPSVRRFKCKLLVIHLVGALVMFNPVDDTSQVAQDLKREQEIKHRAYELLAEHGLDDWFFEFHDAMRRAGQCIWSRKVIAFSRTFINSEWYAIDNVLLHEIAHAITDPEEPYHGDVWKRNAMRVGADPSYITHDLASSAKPNFYLKCPACGQRWYRFRLKRRMIGRKSICCKVPLEGYRIKKGE